MSGSGMLGRDGPAAVRPLVATVIGVVVALVVGAGSGWRYAPAAGWSCAAVIYLVSIWLTVGRMDNAATAAHATREDPTRPLTDAIVVLAGVASLAGVIYLLVAGSASGADAEVAAGVGIADVASAWLVVHTVFMLRYARLYYGGEPGGIDFNQQEPPAYPDFAYLSFTLGMTYQVSDTNLQNSAIRATVLRHSLLSYLLGAVILATVVNLVAALAH